MVQRSAMPMRAKEGTPDNFELWLDRPWTQCQWMISPSYSPVVLSFQRFSLARADTVTVYDGSRSGNIIATFSGTVPACMPAPRMLTTCIAPSSAAACVGAAAAEHAQQCAAA